MNISDERGIYSQHSSNYKMLKSNSIIKELSIKELCDHVIQNVSFPKKDQAIVDTWMI